MVQNMSTPIRIKAITKDAGPPWARAEPEVTKRPVPAKYRQCVCSGAQIIARIFVRALTNGTANSDHLQMASLQLLRKARVRGSLRSRLMVEASPRKLAIGSLCCLGHMGIGIALEAVEGVPDPRLLLCVHLHTSIPLGDAGRVQGLAIVCGLLGVSFVRGGRHGVEVAPTAL